jgi:hypothetical protein
MFDRLKEFMAAPEQKVSRTGALIALESGRAGALDTA